MNTGTIENIKTINKIQKQSKVIESIKRNKREKIDVKIENLKQFIIDNRYNIENFKFDYHNNQGEKRTIEKRLFTNGGYIYYFKKGSSKGGYKVDFSNYKNLKITSIMKSGFDSNVDLETLKRLETWKKLSKFRDLKFHPNLIGNCFYNACQKIQKKLGGLD